MPVKLAYNGAVNGSITETVINSKESPEVKLVIPEQNITTSTGKINAYIYSPSGYNVPQITKSEIEGGTYKKPVFTFKVIVNGVSSASTVTLNALGGIPDKKFNTSEGHKFIYLPVLGPDGKWWLNNNLGADYANVNSPVFDPAKQAQSYNDHHAYGSLFQWGRVDDTGYELINWTSALGGTPVKANAGWKDNSQLPNYDNDPCPNGWRTPNVTELTVLRDAIGGGRSNFASSALHLPTGGYRYSSSAWLGDVGRVGNYWSSNSDSTTSAHSLYISVSEALIRGGVRANARSVRCLKDKP